MASPSTRIVVRITSAASVALVALSSGGCGGTVFSSGVTGSDGGATNDDGGGSNRDGSADGGVTSDGGADALSDGGGWTTCPTPAMPGAACSPNGLQCEYGKLDPNAACDTFEACQSGTFQTYVVPNPPDKCPTPTPANEGKCPAAYGLVPIGTACPEDGLNCAYPEGLCACTRESGGGPVSGTPKWACPTPGGTCPTTRPRIGSACPTEGQDCNYGECIYRGGVNLKCTSGLWQHQIQPCPQ
jgi:hypothetical protein